MTFLYPLGLLGLIGIPILILVYIIKSKYTEQTIASTYLWELSERFLKKKKRVSRLTGLISLILQLLAVTILSLAIAHPIITVPNAANEYCFILDGTGSMNMETEEGNTRFQMAKDVIEDRIDSAVDGSVYTLVYVGDTTSIIYERLEEKDQAKLLLQELKPSHSKVQMQYALSVAQAYFSENPGIKTVLVTDTTYKTAENIEVVKVGQALDNYALSNVKHQLRGEDLTVTGTALSYENDKTLTIGLFMDGATEPVDTVSVEAVKGEHVSFTLGTKTKNFASITVKILEEDALALDNTYIIHDIKSENSYNTLIVSERPFFIKTVISSILNAKIDTIDPKDYKHQTGYGLYIFDTVVADDLVLPTDGTVWLINVLGSVEGAGYSVQGEMDLVRAEKMEYSTSSSSSAQALMNGMKGEDIYMTGYIKCAFYRSFTTLLSYKGSPLVFAGSNENGCREVVFAFDLHRTNMPLLHDYVAMMKNLVAYSFPDMIESPNYNCGELAQVNVIPNTDSIRVVTPSGDISYLNTNETVDHIPMNEVGIYTVNMTVDGTSREFYIYSSLNEEERDPSVEEDMVSLQGQATDAGFDGKYDPLTVMFIVLAVLFLADWMVYCYEKYQLR